MADETTTGAGARGLGGVVNVRRLLIAVPVLVALGVAVFLLVDRGDATATTPKAVLLEAGATASGEDVGVRKGQAARDFSAALPDGTTVRLSELRGTPVVVNFWATWCTSCLAEMPDLKAVQQEFGAEQVQVLAVNSGESFGDAGVFIEWLDAPDFLFAFDPSLAVTDAYGVVGLSHTVFVDADGVITSTYTGQLTPDLMREYTRDAIASTISAEAPFKLRLPGTVEARDSTLVVEETTEGGVRISGRRLRCDDTFCAAAAVDALREHDGIIDVTPALEADPPSVAVVFDAASIDARGVGELLADLLDGLEDPLYQHPIVVEVE